MITFLASITNGDFCLAVPYYKIIPRDIIISLLRICPIVHFVQPSLLNGDTETPLIDLQRRFALKINMRMKRAVSYYFMNFGMEHMNRLAVLDSLGFVRNDLIQIGA